MDYAIDAAYAVVLLYLSYTDLREGRIPNYVILPAAAVALLEAVVAGTWHRGVPGGIVGAALFFLPVLIYKPAHAGAGDVKLAFFIGIWLGYPAIFGAILFSALAISLLALVSWLRGTFDRKAIVPMAPFLSFGTFMMLVVFGV